MNTFPSIHASVLSRSRMSSSDPVNTQFNTCRIGPGRFPPVKSIESLYPCVFPNRHRSIIPRPPAAIPPLPCTGSNPAVLSGNTQSLTRNELPSNDRNCTAGFRNVTRSISTLAPFCAQIAVDPFWLIVRFRNSDGAADAPLTRIPPHVPVPDGIRATTIPAASVPSATIRPPAFTLIEAPDATNTVVPG